MKTKTAKDIHAWMSIMNQHDHETAGFSKDLATIAATELAALKPVTRQALDFSAAMIGLVAPKDLAKLRRAIAYLTDLHERQQTALANQAQAWNAERRAIAEQIKAASNGGI